MTSPPSRSPLTRAKRYNRRKRVAAAIGIAGADLSALVKADKGREAGLQLAAEMIGDAAKTLRAAVLGLPPYRRPSMRATEYVFRFARMLDMPGTQVLAIIQREVGADPATAKAAVAAWQDAGTMTPEAKAELAEAWLAEYHGLPVGIMRDAILRTKAGRLEWRQENGDGPSAEDVGDGQG